MSFGTSIRNINNKFPITKCSDTIIKQLRTSKIEAVDIALDQCWSVVINDPEFNSLLFLKSFLSFKIILTYFLTLCKSDVREFITSKMLILNMLKEA